MKGDNDKRGIQIRIWVHKNTPSPILPMSLNYELSFWSTVEKNYRVANGTMDYTAGVHFANMD